MPAKPFAASALTEPPAIEILRGDAEARRLADAKSFHVVYTIPGALVD